MRDVETGGTAMNAGPAAAAARTFRWQATMVGLLVGVAAVLVVGLIGGARAWAAAARPARVLAGPAELSGVSCTGGSFCIAVGSYSKPGHAGLPLLEEQTGRKWQVLPAPPGFDGITCTGPSFCLAATSPPGSPARTMVWNGRVWRTFKYQSPDMYNITCASSAFCVTYIDDYDSENPPDVVAWTGKDWQAMPGATNGCQGPDCTLDWLRCSSPTNCSTYGTTCDDYECDATLGFWETWNGSAWIQANPPPISGEYMACAGRAFCLAVLDNAAMITRNWGSSWQYSSVNRAKACQGVTLCGQPAQLSCGSPWFCMELATQHAKITPAWTGTRWKAVPVARIDGRVPVLTGLSCGSRRNCAAIGTYQLARRDSTQLIAEHWNGSAWQITPTPIP
jgi:hypothetical protein